MEKKYIIRFLKQKKKGAYTLLVNEYAELIASMPIAMALEIIHEDLQKNCEEVIDLNYFSLVRAFSRFKKKNIQKIVPRKWEFKDAHELIDDQSRPGRFKLK